jgi:hypothetical protein
VSCQCQFSVARREASWRPPNRYRARSRPRSSLSSAFSVRFPLRRIDTDNEHDHDRKTNADTPYADTFPPPPNAERFLSSLAQKLRRELESFGQQGAPILI